jgi:iron complex outermembrane receptor protein
MRGHNLTSPSNTCDTYSDPTPTRRYAAQIVSVFATAVVSAPLYSELAVAAEPAEQTSKDSDQAEVVITGTHVQARMRLDTLAPVDVLSTQALAEQGTTELAQALSTVAPSLDFPRPSVTDATDHIRPATLRGLSPDETLVLVNSKRRHATALVNINTSIGRGSAAVDLNAIPIAAIDHIEVLRDGASAQYGSDAIAGVINIQLRQARQGGEASLTYGEYDTDVRTARGERTAHDGGTLTASAWTGLPLGPRGFLTLTGEFRDGDPTSRGDYDTRIPPLTGPTITSRFGDPRVKDKTAYANAGGVTIGEEWELYGWAGFQQRNGQSAAIPRLANNPNNVLAIYPNGFLPFITTDVKDYVAASGARGQIAGWSTDVSLEYGRNDIQLGVENTVNPTYGAASPTRFNAGSMSYDQLVFDFSLVRGFDWGLAQPANVALGAEARREGYSIEAGDPESYDAGPLASPTRTPGAQGFPGFQPANALDKHRMSYSAYADLETQLTQKFLGSAALRGEHYSDFGSTATGKLSARYDFVHAFAVRGTVSNGFRAPGLQQEYFTSTAINFINGVPFDIGTFPATAPISRALGASPLRPEKSRNYSLGVVFRPLDSVEATLDAYRIDVTDRIVLSENLGGVPNIDALIQPFGVGRARFFINGVDTRTKGLDFVLRYRPSLGIPGKLALTASGNWNTTDVTRLPSTGVLSTLNPPPVLFGRINTLTFEDGTPKNKINAAADWSYPVGFGNLGAGLKVTRYGEVLQPGTTPAADVRINSTTLVDFELRARVGEHFGAAIGADNIFDQYPQPYPSALNSTGVLGFPSYSPFGFDGRFVYARLNWSW